MARFEDAPQDVLDLVASVRRREYGDLDEAKVTIKTMMAFGPTDDDGELTGLGLKLHGYACLGVIKITSYEARVAGHDDAILKLDGDRWKELAEEDKEALIAHELTHLLLLRDKDGVVKRDECGRPKMRARLHDVQVGWFVEIARKYGRHSQEVQQARVIMDEHGQLLFDWADEVDLNKVVERTEQQIKRLKKKHGVEEPNDDAQDHEERATTARLKGRSGFTKGSLEEQVEAAQ